MTAPHHHTPVGVGGLEALVYTVSMKWGETVIYQERTLNSLTENLGSLPGCGT